jgi:hypothetical protein
LRPGTKNVPTTAWELDFVEPVAFGLRAEPPVVARRAKPDKLLGRTSRRRLVMKSRRAWYLLLVLPFVALLCPVYLRLTPAIAGIPFFYWYQFLLLFLSAGLTGIVYYAVRETEQ